MYTEEQEGKPLHWLTGKELPAVLPEEKEKELIQKLGTDNDRKARDELMTHNLRLGVWAADKYRTDPEMEELLSAGAFGLVKAIDSYDPVQSKRIATYATHCIENEMKMYLRKRRKILDHETELPEQEEKTEYGDPVANRAIKHLLAVRLKEALSTLSSSEKEVIRLRYFSGSAKGMLSQEETAAAVGMSQSCLSRKERRILKKLREQLQQLQ